MVPDEARLLGRGVWKFPYLGAPMIFAIDGSHQLVVAILGRSEVESMLMDAARKALDVADPVATENGARPPGDHARAAD